VVGGVVLEIDGGVGLVVGTGVEGNGDGNPIDDNAECWLREPE
jgi:hypothetical protein